MSEDIKGILLFLEFTKNEDIKRQWLFKDEATLLLDYITNLQQELNNQIEIANNRYVEITKLQQENEKLKELKEENDN